MATVKIVENMFESTVNTFEAECNQTVEEIIRKQSDGTKYDDYLVECYDCETGETIYAPISDDNENLSVMVTVNGQSQDLDYIVEKNDVIEIVFLPLSNTNNWNWQGALIGNLLGSFEGFLAGSYYGPWGMLIGAAIGGTIGFIAGGIVGADIANRKTSSSYKNDLSSNSLPDTRGASNQNLTNNAFPFVLGKHLATPFIAGSPYNDILGFYGEENYITALYLVGHSPLKLTELRLGDIILAHNGGKGINDCVYHGRLSDNDIESIWNNNDIKVEILQQGQNGEPVDYQTLYLFAKKQRDINASVLYIMDNPSEMANVSYKGLSLKNGLRNQPVRYTEEYPKSAKVELNFPSGLYKTYTRTDDDGDSEVKYEKIPLWCAIQWRVSSDANDVPDGEKNGIIANEFRQGMDSWKFTNKRGWQTFNPSQQKAVCTVMNSITSSNESMTYVSQRNSIGDFSWDAINHPWTEYILSSNYNIAYNLDTRYLSLQDNVSEPTVRNIEADKNYVYSIRLKLEFKWRMTYKISTSYAQTVTKTKDFTDIIYQELSGTVYKDDLNSIINETVAATSTSIKVKVDNTDPWGRIPSFELLASKVSVDYLKIDGTTVTKKGGMKDFVASSLAYSEPAYQDGYLSDLKNAGVTNVIQLSTYDASARTADINAHSGNRSIPANINDGWLNTQCFNFSELCGSRDKQGGLNEIRFTTEVDFVEWAREKFDGQYSTEEEFNALFKQYFYPASNTTKSIEIRVVRLSPNYQNESSSSGKNSAATFNDVFTWRTLTCTMLDEKAIENNSQIIQKRPLPEEDMRKYCLVAIRAKSDNVDQLSSTLKKFSCTAESFAPYFDTTERKWFPENVTQSYKYFEPNYKDSSNKWHRGAEITAQEFITRRQNGEKAIKAKNGNNFTKDLVTNVIRTQNNLVNGRYVIRGDNQDTYVNGWNLNPYRYLENNVASMILLAGIGAQAGINALSYKDYDLISLAKMFEFCESVKDGSTYNTGAWKYNSEGQYVIDHIKGTPVDMKFTANAYIYNAEKLEDIIAKLCIAGRSVVTRNRNNQLTFIVDKPEPYHVALINQANTISSSYSLKYDDNVSGFMINYPDENDGYNQNTLYAMKDAETVEDHRGNIEAYQFAYVTNPYQAWSLGRYLLANKVMNKEVVTKKIGMEGYSIGLGNIVCVQDDTMMIGTDFGGRITELIEDDDYIYGFLINNTYHFTDEREETDNDLVKKGVMVMQPSLSPYEQSRVVILRLAPAGTHKTITRYVDMGNGERTIRTEEFTVKKGQTNVVILKNKVSKHSNYVINDETNEEVDTFLVKPQVDNIVGFGDVNSISALYRVIGIKPDNKHNYELSLLKYQPELYEYGRELPSFQNNMTKRDYVDESYALTESATREDINVFVKNVLDITDTKIDERFDGLATSNIVTLYKRSATTPRLPSVNAYYDFSKPMTDASKLGFIQLWAGPFDTKEEAMVEGSVDKGSWTVSTEYDELDVVAEGGKYYRCTTEHTSSNVSFDNDFNGSAGWTLNIPDGSLPLYITVASATSNTSIATIESDDWSSPKLFTSSSTDRADVIWLYKRSVLEPTAPIESLVYDFENGVFKGDASTIATKLDGWVLGTDKDGMAGISDNFAVALWVTTAGAIGKTETTIDPSDWTKPLKLVSGAAFTHKIEANVDSVTSTIVPAEFIVHKRPEGVIYKIDNPMLAAAGSTLSLKVQKIVDEGGENETRYDITGYYIVEQLTKNYEVVAIGNLPANSTITFTMPSTDVRVKVYNESSKIQLLDIERINVLTDNKFTANVNDCYIQIPTNSNLFPVNSGSKEIVIKAAYEDEILRYDDEDVYTNRYKIINVVVYHTAFTVRQTVSGGFVIEYNSSKAIPSGMQGLATIECYYGGYKNKVINIPFQVKAIDNGEVVPADSDRTEEVKAAYYKPDIDILNFSFLKSDDGIDYEEFDGYYKLWLSRKDGEWGFLPEGAEERVPNVVGSGTSLEYNLVENFIGDLSNPITAYRLDLYRDAEYTQLLDSETIPVLYDDDQIRIDMTNDNVSLVANSSGEVISFIPTASNIAVYKGKDKLEYSNTALTTLIQNLGDAKAQYYYNIEITPTNCTGQTITSTDPKNILLGSISAVTDVDLMFAYRTITIKYIMIGKKLVGFSGSGRNIKPKYQRTHKIEESSVVQAIAIVKNGETRKIKFAVGPFGLDTSSSTDMSSLTWYDNMPVRTSSQCIYMAVENTTQLSN